MSEQTRANESIFPAEINGQEVVGGITRREYFAAMALSGMMSPNPTMGLQAELLARYAVATADALIEVLNK